MATDWHLVNSLIKALSQRQRDQVDGLMAQLQATERALSSDRAAGDAMAQGHVDYLLDLAHSSAGAFLTAITGEQIIGFCVVIITKEDECNLHLQDSFKQAGEVTDLIVHPNHRKRGIGRALISAASAHCQARGVRQLKLKPLLKISKQETLLRRWGFGRMRSSIP